MIQIGLERFFPLNFVLAFPFSYHARFKSSSCSPCCFLFSLPPSVRCLFLRELAKMVKPDIHTLAHHLKQERLYTASEKQLIQRLNGEVLKTAERLYRAAWIAKQQRINLDRLILTRSVITIKSSFMLEYPLVPSVGQTVLVDRIMLQRCVAFWGTSFLVAAEHCFALVSSATGCAA